MYVQKFVMPKMFTIYHVMRPGVISTPLYVGGFEM